MPREMKATLSLVQEETPISHKWRYVVVHDKALDFIDRVMSAPAAAIFRAKLNFASDHLKHDSSTPKGQEKPSRPSLNATNHTPSQRISGSTYEGNYKVAATCYLSPVDPANSSYKRKSSGSLTASATLGSVTSSAGSTGGGSASMQSWAGGGGLSASKSTKRFTASSLLSRIVSSRDRVPVARIHFQQVQGFTDAVPEAKSELEATNMVLIFVVDLCTTPDGHNPPLPALVQDQVKAVERRVVEVKVMRDDVRPTCVLLCLTAGADESELDPVRELAPKHGFAREFYVDGFQDDELYHACQRIGNYLLDPNRRQMEIEKAQIAAKIEQQQLSTKRKSTNSKSATIGTSSNSGTDESNTCCALM